MDITITKRDGTREQFNADRINRSIERACAGLPDSISKVTQIATETQLTLYDGITTEELDQATISAALQNVASDPDYDQVATRLLLKTIYNKVLGSFNDDDKERLRKMHRDNFVTYVQKGIDEGLLDKRMMELYNVGELSMELDIDRDELFDYAGLSSLLDRYTVKGKGGVVIETPQYAFMRIAMGLAYNEGDPTEWAKKFYNKMSRLEYVAGGSTNIGAGSSRPALSNCFLLEIHDDMEHIAKSVADVIKISKATGGIGASITKLRATGSPLASNNTTSSGPTPFAKIIDTAIRAVARAGKKKGALAFYMENWHIDFPEFLEWKHNAGDDYMRMRTANTAAYLSDEFMKRVESGDSWYMFDPKDTPDLNELYGKEFSDRYKQYVELAEKGEMRVFKKVPAREQWRQIITLLMTTAHPWITWKDTINLRALNNNTGTIHMSNLCTEICLPQDKDNIAVCNLASLNLNAHLEGRDINWKRLEESIRLAVRQLDNLIDINELPIPEAVKSDRENRAVGLGVMGFADTVEKLGFAYDSEDAYNFADKVFEFFSYIAIDESANLAQTRGAYHNFPGSGWSKGMVPVDTLKTLEDGRGRTVLVSRAGQNNNLDWDALRAKVKNGIRNATLMAVAPNANIGLVAGTTPGFDPRFAQVFSRNKISGKYLDINKNLVKDLKTLGIWDDVKDEVLGSHGNIADIDAIPSDIKKIYKTSFTTSPYAYIEVAARAQKWIDQALSRNMYLRTRNVDEIMDIYRNAWDKGVKTTYYLHMEPRHTAEQSTVSVNKAKKMGKKGFGSLSLMTPGADQRAQSEQAEIAARPATASPFSTPEPQMAPVVAATPRPAPAQAAAPIAESTPNASPAKGFGFGGVAPQVVSAQQSQPKVQDQQQQAVPQTGGFGKVSAGITAQASQMQPQAQQPQKSRPQIELIPSDPQEDLICDSCQ